MFCSSQFIASTGDRPQLVGQVDSTSIMVKPFTLHLQTEGLGNGLLALAMLAVLLTATRSM